jgi:hypothetical protein
MNLKMIKYKLLCALFTMASIASWNRTGQADLLLTFQDTTFNSGELGSVDVFVRSTSATGDDLAQLFNCSFRITQVGQGSPGFLTFQPTASQLKSEQGSTVPPYIFLGDTSPDNFSAVTQPDATQITSFDFTNSGNNFTIGTSNQLLARLELQHIGAALTGQFQISLVQDSNLTFFTYKDQVLDDIFAAIDSNSYSSFGMITITSVPEPSSILILLPISLIWCSRIWRKRRHSPLSCTEMVVQKLNKTTL